MLRALRLGCWAIAIMLAGQARADPDPFVRVEGDHFAVGAERFAFVGANLQIMHGERVQSRYKSTLAAAAGDGLGVGRVWAFGEGPADASDWYRAHELFRAGPDGYIEEAYRHLDRVLAEAAAQHLRLVITLSNNWSDYGGVPMYLRWAGLPEGKGPDDPVREAFYSDEKVRGYFEGGLGRLLGRTNSVTGVRYVDDPTIFAWELMNESSVPTPRGAEARRGWLVQMARYIKARDPHHLVSAGVAGYDTREQRAEWLRVHQLPEIDYCDAHLYPQMLGADRIHDDKTLYALLDDHAQLARFVIGKPLVIGEFGFRTDQAKPWLGARRAAWFRRLVGRAFDDGIAGAMAWIYQPWSGRPRDFGIYVDHPATDDVRAALRALAVRAKAAPQATNTRLGPSVGERYLYDPRVTVRHPNARLGRWQHTANGELLEIDPHGYVEARFERVGNSPGGRLRHVYGAGFGELVYRFRAPSGPPARRLRITARISSEWPGYSAPADGGSVVEVQLDGRQVATVDAVPDDGAGKVVEVIVDDARALARLEHGMHRLSFVVADTPGAHGLCVYGAASTTGLDARTAVAATAIACALNPAPITIAAAAGALAITPESDTAIEGEIGPVRIFWERGATRGTAKEGAAAEAAAAR